LLKLNPAIALITSGSDHEPVNRLIPIMCATTCSLALIQTSVAWAADDLLNNASSPDAGSSSFSIQTDRATSKVWFQANRFDATEDGDVSQISLQLEVSTAKQNAAAAATSVQIHSNDSNNEMDTSIATFTYDSHSVISTTGTRDDINVHYTGTATLAAGTYWLATYSSGDRDTDDESASLSYSSLSNQLYEGPWRWVAGEQNRYSQAVVSTYSTVPVAPITVVLGVRTNPPEPDPTPSSGGTSPDGHQVTLTLTLPGGVECQSPSLTTSGAWVQLPGTRDCSIASQATDTNPQLLGWATDPAFPVGIAQRQVENGWGAYETFNDNSQLTGVFIPAGGYTAITGDTNLYPIWSE